VKRSLNVLHDDILKKIVNKYKTLFSRIKYKLKDWIPVKELLKEYPNKIYLPYLSKNTNDQEIELLKTKPD